MTIAVSAERRHALDAVRAFALFAGIALHATMSFVPGFAPSAPRSSLDVSPSATLAVLFFAIHIFRMSLFFVIAGFFARALVIRDGPRAFVANRRRRVLLPLLLAYVTIGPLVIAAVVYQTVMLYGELAAAPQLPGAGVPLLHSGFSTICCGSTLLGLPVAVSLFLLPSWDPWAGISTPDRGFVPKLVPLLAFGTAFAVGWFMHRQRRCSRSSNDVRPGISRLRWR